LLHIRGLEIKQQKPRNSTTTNRKAGSKDGKKTKQEKYRNQKNQKKKYDIPLPTHPPSFQGPTLFLPFHRLSDTP
jgi:hypothetical protein